MIQFKSKHKYSSKSDRWYPMILVSSIDELDFEDYMYILGDKIFKEKSQAAKEALDTVIMWNELM